MRAKLETLPMTELRELAKVNGIKGITTMRKAALIDKILEVADSGKNAGESSAKGNEKSSENSIEIKENKNESSHSNRSKAVGEENKQESNYLTQSVVVEVAGSAFDVVLEPELFNLLKALAGGVGYLLPHDPHVGEATYGKEQECSGRCKVLEHPGGELAYEEGCNPQGESGNRHGDATNGQRVHLAEDNEDHGADRTGTANDVGDKEDEQPDAADTHRLVPLEVAGDKQQRHYHAGDAIVDERLAAHTVDDEHGEHGGDHVGKTDNHLIEEGVALTQTGVLEDVGAVVENGVHTHELTEHGDADSDDNGSADSGTEERAVTGIGRLGSHFECLGNLTLDFGNIVVNFSQDTLGAVNTTLEHQPAGAVGDKQHGDEEYERRHDTDAEHTTPPLVDEYVL